MGGIAAAKGRYVVMGDSDDSYDFGDIPRFLEELRKEASCDGQPLPGRHPAHCHATVSPLFRQSRVDRVGKIVLRQSVWRLLLWDEGLQQGRLPATRPAHHGDGICHRDGGEVHPPQAQDCRSPDYTFPGRPQPPTALEDLARRLANPRFFLLYSPRWLFLYPGAALMLLGVLAGAWLLPEPRRVGAVVFDVHTLLYAAIAVLLGFQAMPSRFLLSCLPSPRACIRRMLCWIDFFNTSRSKLD